jgi:CDP-paratose 2-epimerase
MSSKGKVLITGSAGFIGTNVAIKFLESDYEVVGFDNLQRDKVYRNLEYVQKKYKDKFKFIWGDVRNQEDIERLPNDAVALLHFSANPGIPRSMEQPKYDFNVNANGTLNILEFSRKNGKIPVLYSSTNKVYSDGINQIALIESVKRYDIATGIFEKIFVDGATEYGFTEDFAIDGVGVFPHSPYGCSKYAGDIYCQEYFHVYDIPTVVNRQSCISGLFAQGVCEQGWINWFCRAKLSEKPLEIFGNGKQVRDVLDGRDLADLYLMQVENIDKFKGQVFNVGGGIENSVSLLEVIDYLDKKYSDICNDFKLEFKDWRLADHRLYISDISKIKSKGWEPKIGVWECVEAMCAQIEQNPALYID